MYFLRRIARLILTKIKRLPSSPHTPPITTAAGISRREDSESSSFPNLREPSSVSDNGLPSLSYMSIPRVKVAIEQAAKTRHNMLNVQKVFGFEIS